MRSAGKVNREELGRAFLLQSGAVSLAFHCVLLAILAFGLRYSFPRGQAGVYTVSIRSISSPGGGTGNRASITPPNALTTPLPPASATEKAKKDDSFTETISVREKKGKPKERISPPPEKSEPVKSKKEDSIEGLKPSRGKKEREEKYSSGDLQQALDEIRRQAAIDKIKSRVDRRSKAEPGTGDSASKGDASARIGSQGQTSSLATGIAGPGRPGVPGAGTGASEGGVGGPGGPGSIFGFGSGGTKLEEYYGMIWSKVKQEWTVPGNVITKKDELETIVVLIIDKQGKVQKTWFEKKSGNNLYDQSAMRAIKKAEPFPPLPKELGEDPFELALRFTPD